MTDTELNNVLDELMKLELFFHHPTTGTTRRDLEALTDDTFWEVGASGRKYDRDVVLRVLEERTQQPPGEIWDTQDPACRHLGGDHFLVTYTLFQGKRETLRVSLWRRTGSTWKVVYHQGTVVE